MTENVGIGGTGINVRFDLPPTEYVFYPDFHDNRWSSTCSCGWKAPVTFVDNYAAAAAWQTHRQVRHGG